MSGGDPMTAGEAGMREWFDETGEYPSEAALERIRTWPSTDCAGCLDFARAIWHWPDWAGETLKEAEKEMLDPRTTDRFARFATGGWSGNESIIGAIEANRMVSLFCWQLSARGGLHIYQYPEGR